MKKRGKHIQKYFYDWYQQTLDPKMKQKVESHLQSCSTCRQYYEKMRTLLDQPDLSVLPNLTPDPYLPEKIIRHPQPKLSETQDHQLLPGYLRWSFATLLIILSFSLGIYLGKGIFYNKSVNYDSQLSSAYYQHFSQGSVLEEFDQIMNYVSEE